ncbi:hypothetical protein [Burkholderia sp. AU45388]|uniref:hypothetical protein n=1 Tax=Burkholderia sp. AU45388 TaxID=3059206 RepID=UPI00265076DA|nr:hypothetical protein [Burkholderia sp. AU45388]MDN7427730.1 hypothetical protein [Burkholderia sp. AU45388]
MEIEAQASEMGVAFDEVIVPHGSGGTHAGLVARFVAQGRTAAFVRSHAVLADEDKSRMVSFEKSTATLDLLGHEARFSVSDLNIDDSHLGDGYGLPTDGMREPCAHLPELRDCSWTRSIAGGRLPGFCTMCGMVATAPGKMSCS